MNIDFSEHSGIRAYSSDQFWQLLENHPNYDFGDYGICQTIGTYVGRLMMKKWGQKRNIICYVDCSEQHKRKIICTAFQDTDYLGLADIPMGAYIKLAYEQSNASRKIRLAKVDVIGNNMEEGEHR